MKTRKGWVFFLFKVMGRIAFCVVNYFILMASKCSGYIEKIKKIEEKCK